MLTLLLFGATGSAGSSVLRECLASPAVGVVRAITRRPLGLTHRKLETILHDDYEHYDAVAAAFAGVDACLFCLGKSVSQVADEADYRRITHDFAMAAAKALGAASPEAVFHYVSGRGAALDSRFMWARVKAETERDLLASATALCWRPGAIDALPSASEPPLTRYIRPWLRLLSPFPSLYISGADLGRAMVQEAAERTRGRILENREIRRLASRARALDRLDALRTQ